VESIIGDFVMNEDREIQYPELIFQFMVFQSYLDKNFIWYYLDGSSSRRTLNIPAFLKMVQDHWPSLAFDCYTACRDTSFHLLNLVDMSVIHLTPQGNMDVPYLDSIRNMVQSKKTGKSPKKIITEKQSLTDTLQKYGFNTPSKNSVENLTVSLERHTDRDGFISRFLNRTKRD
jgi:hypothetical protein